MDSWIRDYVGSCEDCQKDNVIRHTWYGLLQPLEVPYAPWNSISMDFITDLPLSNGHDSIWVIVHRFTKMAHFVPLKSDTKKESNLARVFFLGKSGGYMGCLVPSSQTEMCDSPLSFGRLSLVS